MRRRLDGGADISEQELRFIIEASHDLLAITSFEGYFLLLSPAWESALGYSRDELRAKPFLEFVHPDDRAKTDVVTQRIQPGVELLSFTNRYVAKDGSIRHLSWKGIVSVDAQRYYTSAVDRSETLQRNEAADAMDSLCELVPAAVVMQTSLGEVSRWDGRAQELFGWTTSAMEGQPLGEYLRDADGNATDLTALADLDIDDIEVQLRTPNGQYVACVAQVRSFGDGVTPVTGAVAILLPQTRG
jgi:PAS domain S-box-containing protein